MEPSSSEASCGSDLDEGVDSSDSTSRCPLCDKSATSDAAFGCPVQERSLQALTKQPRSKRECLNSSEESSGKGDASTSFHFLKKLWHVVESGRFESIWWGDNGECVAIREELFEKEVLARRGCWRLFESKSMESFTHCLQLHGFTRKLWDFPKLGSCYDLLMEETAREFHFYSNPNFRRRFPHLLMKYEQSCGPKHQTPAGLLPGTRLHVRCRSRKPAVEPAWETTSEGENGPRSAGAKGNTHTSARRRTAPAKRRARAATRARCASAPARTAALTNSAGGREQPRPLAPSLRPQHSSPGAAGGLSAASAAPSPGCTTLAVPSSPFPPGLPPRTSPAAASWL
ncbi:heat shock transcription factor, Y-linked-like [Phalacrocorax carbo]|uniref:heat shock transcription factor, Y-linked-like n=1 Tax=Phalacrocorax carbo TaxID=9209 RepID=UPI00311A1AE0